MPKVTPGPGQAVEEHTVTRIVPANTEPDKLSADPIEYMDAIGQEKWDQGNHIIYLYRLEPPLYRGGGAAYVTKYAAPVTLDQVQQEYGGGLFRLLIKRGPERVADARYQLSGTPRDLTRSMQEFAPALPGGVPPATTTDGTSSVVNRALDIASNPNAQQAQTDLLVKASTAAIELVKANVPAAPPQLGVKEILEIAEKLRPAVPASTEPPFFQTEVGKILVAAASAVVTALVNRLVSPVDPIDQISKYADVIAKFNPAGGSSTSDWKAALVNAAPQLALAVKDTVQELRLGTEAQMRYNAGRTLPAGPPPPPPAVPVQSNPGAPAPPNVVEMPPPAPEAGQGMEPFERKLVELLSDPKMTGDAAGEILDKTWPRMIDEIATYSVDQIMGAFQMRPILQPHANNPRLRQFITEFLAWAKDTDTAPLTPPAPAS
jgi:hypothetical protein